MEIFTKFYFLQCSKAELWIPHSINENMYDNTTNVKHKSENHSSVTLFIICVYVLNKNTNADL